MQSSSRLDRLPPYLFAELERKITERKAAGVDVISLGIGDPDTPTPDVVIDALAAARATPARIGTRPTAGARSCARRSRASTSGASAWRSTPTARSFRRWAPRSASST